MKSNLILIITTTLTALIAGLFYGYSCSVNIGLGKLNDTEYLTAMQSINKEIQNPLFFLSFMGTLILLPISTFIYYQSNKTVFYLLLLASLIYAIAVFGVTAFGNVPLNQALENFNIKTSTIEQITNQRLQFEVLWNRLHAIRTIASIASLVIIVIACIEVRKI